MSPAVRVLTLDSETRRLAIEDLARSGLGPECLRPGTGISALSREEAKRHGRDLRRWWAYAPLGLCVLLFEYADLDGKPTGIWRMRRLEKPLAGVGAALDLPRYLGPPNERPGVWLSRAVPWREALSKPDAAVIVVEGEKKAEKLCREGLLAIGLAGVWSTSSKRRRIEVLPELLGIEWSGRRVVVLFDADPKRRTQIDVARATSRAGDFFRSQGAEVFKAQLPLLEGETT